MRGDGSRPGGSGGRGRATGARRGGLPPVGDLGVGDEQGDADQFGGRGAGQCGHAVVGGGPAGLVVAHTGEQIGDFGERQCSGGIVAVGEGGQQGQSCLAFHAAAVGEVDAAGLAGGIGGLPPVAAHGGGKAQGGTDVEGAFASGQGVQVGGGVGVVVERVGGRVVDQPADDLQAPLFQRGWCVRSFEGVVHEGFGGQRCGVLLGRQVVQFQQGG